MATLTIRNVPDATQRALKARAAKHNRSMEAEVREILESSVHPAGGFIDAWLHAAEQVRGEFELPARAAGPRPVDLA